MSINFHDSGPINYLLKEDFIVTEYKKLIRKCEDPFYDEGNIEIIDYCEIYKDDEERKSGLEEENRLSMELNDLFEHDGIYIYRENNCGYY